MQSLLKNKKILLGVTGGIAAYKAAYLIREFIKLGAEVKVAVTPSALEFITPLTLSTLSNNAIITSVFPDSAEQRTWHIDLSIWADVFVIAPCTINTVSKIANGIADNAVTVLAAARRAPVVVCPAADMDMYNNHIIQDNLKKLAQYGFNIVEADEGELASGLKGKGRMPQINKIIDATKLALLNKTKDLVGKKILVSAGPTYEDIDPVRYVGNRSSGKMGYEIAKSASLRGAEVMMISGPSNETAYDEIKVAKVRSCEEMLQEIEANLVNYDYLFMAAAPADFTPSNINHKKIKKDDGLNRIDLKNTVDILKTISKKNKTIVGFALETDNELENANKKLAEKKIDFVVLNSLNDKDAGFEFDTNKITIISKDKDPISSQLISKFEAANLILDATI